MEKTIKTFIYYNNNCDFFHNIDSKKRDSLLPSLAFSLSQNINREKMYKIQFKYTAFFGFVKRNPPAHYDYFDLNRRAFPITDTELKLMAAPAIMGLRRMPIKGYKTPAAIGIPKAL